MTMIPSSVGTYSAATGVTTYFQVWHRDTVGLGFNFSGACGVVLVSAPDRRRAGITPRAGACLFSFLSR